MAASRKPRQPVAQAPRPIPFHAAAPRRYDGGPTRHVDVPGVGLTPEEGVVYPQSPDEVRLADLLALPVITEGVTSNG